MANNPYVNKVVYGNSTVMDISDTTAEEADVENGKVFYKANGERSAGTGSMSGAVWGNITGDLSDQTDLAEALDAKAGTSMLRDSLGYLSQDFIPDEYEFTEETINGVTFKAESDGTITLSGRATAATTLVIAQNIPLGRTNYTFKYFLNLQETEKTTGYVDSSKIQLVVSKSGNSASVNLGNIYQYNVSSSASGNYTASLVVENGTDLTSGVYNVYPAILWDKPLIYDVAPASKKTDSVMSAEIEDDDYIPVYDSSSSDVGGVKKSWLYIKTKLKSYFDTLYLAIGQKDEYTASVAQANGKVIFDNLNASYGYELYWDDRGANFDVDNTAIPHAIHTKREAGTTSGTIKLTYTIQGGTNGSSYFALRILK